MPHQRERRFPAVLGLSDLSEELEAFNRARLSAQAMSLQVQIYFSRDALTPALNAWNLSDADEAKRRLLNDINEQKVCEVDSAFPDRLVIVGTTCRLDAEVMEPTRDRLRVIRTTVMNLSQADRSRERIATIPFATFADNPDGGTELKRRAIKELFASLINDASRRETDRLAAERERFYDLNITKNSQEGRCCKKSRPMRAFEIVISLPHRQRAHQARPRQHSRHLG